MQAANRIAKNTGILYIKMAITVFISLYSTRLVLAALGPKDFGLFSLVSGVILMLAFLEASMTATTQRYMSFSMGEGNMQKVNKIFNMSVLLHLSIALIIFILLEVGGYFFFNGILNIEPDKLTTARWIYQFMIISTLFSVISVPYDALLNAHENMLFYAILGIIESLLKLTIAFFITYVSSNKLIFYGALMALLQILLLTINRIYCHTKYPESKINIKANYDKDLLKAMSGFAGWSLLGTSSSMIANFGQGIVINIFFGTVVNAAQGIAAQVSGQLSAFASTMMKALSPLIAKSEGSGNRSLMITAVMMGSKISFFLLTFFFIPVLIEMPYIFKFWLKYVPAFTIIFCQLLLVRNLIEQLFFPLASSISAHGNIKNYQIISSLLCFFPLIITYLLFKAGHPAYFIYIVFILYSIVASFIILYFTWNNYRFPVYRFFTDVVLRSVSSFLVILILSLVPTLFLKESLLRLFFVVSTSCIVYPVSIWFIGFNNGDREKFKQLFVSIVIKYIPKKYAKRNNSNVFNSNPSL